MRTCGEMVCYEAALQVFTETGFPAEWAMTQNILGNAYADLPTGAEKRTSAAPSTATRRHCECITRGTFRRSGRGPRVISAALTWTCRRGSRSERPRAIDCYKAA